MNLLFWSTTFRNVTQKNIITGSQYQFRSAVFFLSVCTNPPVLSEDTAHLIDSLFVFCIVYATQ